LPLVSLNGGVVGYLREDAAGDIVFEEFDAFPLEPLEIDEVLTGVRGLLANGVDDLLVFYHTRDWMLDELLFRLGGLRGARGVQSSSAAQNPAWPSGDAVWRGRSRA
jgi:hypothetical protein